MDLLLEIISHQCHSLPAERTRFTFKAAGGTIGRNRVCDWHIDDPERLISGIHSSIAFENNHFYIRDNSTNGLFVNNQTQPLGDQVHMISNGDQFSLGQFDIRASLIADQNRAVYSSVENQQLTPLGSQQNSNKVSSSNVAIFPDATVQELDPLASFNDVSGPGRLNSTDIMAQADPVNSILNPVPFNQSYIDLPNAIPENWQSCETDDNPGDSNSNPETNKSHYEASVADARDQVGNFDDFNNDYKAGLLTTGHDRNKFSGMDNTLKTGSENCHSNINQNELLSILFETLGIDIDEIKDEKIPQLVSNIALITRHSMQGIMHTMNARAHLKNEFRMERTTIKTEQNNPLKFCINYEQLVHYMLTHPVPGYLDSEQSVKEAFSEVQEHQIAVMSGMKSALMYMLNKLSPEKIQQRTDKTISLTLSNKRTRYWETYKQLYQDIMSEDDVFNHLFGNEFCRAYEQQVEALRHSRNDN